MNVSLTFSEPWDLVDNLGQSRIVATIISMQTLKQGVGREVAAIEPRHPILWQTRTYPYLLITPRRGECLLEQLPNAAGLECSVVGLTSDAPPSSTALAHELEAWRGGLAGRATVRLVAQ